MTNGEADDKTTPGSDLEHVQSLLLSKDYRLPPAMAVLRLVHLMDEMRKELMIIYAEDIARTGLTAAELKEDGNAYDQWPGIEKGMIDRATDTIKIREK